MNKKKESIDLRSLKIVRNMALKINDEMDKVEKVKQELVLKLIDIHHNCNHELVVRYKDNQVGRIVRCLCCTKTFYGPMVGLDFCFANIIDLPDVLQENDMPQLALKLFEQKRIKKPELSDAEIVTIINRQVRKQTTTVEPQGFTKSIGTKQQ